MVIKQELSKQNEKEKRQDYEKSLLNWISCNNALNNLVNIS